MKPNDLDGIYQDAMNRESANHAEYLKNIQYFKGISKTKESIENDLLDTIIFCRWCIALLRKL